MGFGGKNEDGLGPKDDLILIEPLDVVWVIVSIYGGSMLPLQPMMLFMLVGHEEYGPYWFEEPVAPEDLDGYRELRSGLKVNISGGEAEFNRWGWRKLLESRGLDIAQPEVCALGGISEYLRVLALCHAHFTPVVNHVWGSAIAVAANLHLLAAMPAIPGGLFPWEPMLEFDTTHNSFRDDLLTEPLNIQNQVKVNNGTVSIPSGPGLGVTPDREFMKKYNICN